MLNECWEKEIMPDELEPAELVTLYKKGNVEDPAIYKSIALLNTIYENLCCHILQQKTSCWPR